jgi:hypothetical protein
MIVRQSIFSALQKMSRYEARAKQKSVGCAGAKDLPIPCRGNGGKACVGVAKDVVIKPPRSWFCLWRSNSSSMLNAHSFGSSQNQFDPIFYK